MRTLFFREEILIRPSLESDLQYSIINLKEWKHEYEVVVNGRSSFKKMQICNLKNVLQ